MRLLELSDDIVKFRVQVGKGGGGGWEFQGGEAGEDSFVEAVYQDDSVKEVLRARGGRGGASGAGRAGVSSAVLANGAEVTDGLMFLIGGGWRRYAVDTLPGVANFAVAFVVEPDDAEHATITADVIDPKGNRVVTGRQSFDLSRGPVPAAFRFVFLLEQTGSWSVVLRIDEQEIRQLAFEVILRAQAAASASANDSSPTS
jgi:hypothetical protein